MKFSAALPPELAADTLAHRLTDPEAVRTVTQAAVRSLDLGAT